ncbi:polyamine aminopropyltransferase [Streptomyces sp. R302]|uniref:polyamine aminopropyltransferase n=1 Tax=unclassified Streptomyces TaxID=2593676 RepID=UPI00145ED463|nr:MULTISPECIES: polyamine aminopropyltransferase [unclassified Streptomyces]NML52256.1 polyamine aminopropyltransferase [Streptomyces sp. R301]NML82278.1 polyamine aminopropyltransferase [Streptomyces sp. R302]
MIEPTVTLPPTRVRRPPSRPRSTVRWPVLAVVFVCAACGLVYELELVALASYLIGDSVTQASVVLSVMVFAMGLGSLLAKRLRCCAAVGFGLIEGALALVGGTSALVLYACFAWIGASRGVLVAFSLTIGILIGAEIPLLMSLIQRAPERSVATGRPRRARRPAPAGDPDDAAGTVADLFAADYVGALVGGLAFPFLLLPWLGQLTGALVTGAVNAVAGAALVLWFFRRDLTALGRALVLGVNLAVLGVLATATVLVDDFEEAARRAVYGERVRVAVHTELQEVVVTGGPEGPPDLYLDGRLRVAGEDEYRYHEALVHPAMNGPHARVLIVGGGDGLAAREVLRHPGVQAVTVVELDPGVVRLARTDPALAALNGQAFRDPRVRVVHADAFHWLRGASGSVQERYDVVISDLPDPGITPSTKLYSQEFYGLIAGVLADGGRLVVHAGAATDRPRTYWTADATLRAAGYATRPYSTEGRAPGFAAGPDRAGRAGAGRAGPDDWGFLLAVRGDRPPALGLAADGPAPRSLAPRDLPAAARRAERTRITGLPPSTLVHPRYGN